MRNEDIERSLLDCDGSCRDINFSEHISTAGAVALVESIGARWALSWTTDVEGHAVQGADLTKFLANDEGMLSTVWEA